MKIKMKITENELNRIKSFAIKKNHQQTAASSSRDKSRNDQGDRFHREIIGKTCEIGVQYITGGLVDFTIHIRHGFGADITDPTGEFLGKNIHVKSCTVGMNAWLVEKNDPIVTSPTKDDIIFFCEADLEGNYNILGQSTAWHIQHCWGSPRVKSFSSYKYGIELEDAKYRFIKGVRK